MDAAQLCFLALEPDEPFRARVLAWKRRVRELAGDQLYLDHPPHLTLYAALFPPGIDFRESFDEVAARVAAPTVSICGWHVFEADQLTGNNTLVCDVHPGGRPVLEAIQRQAVAAATPLRDTMATRSRYDAVWERLSEGERANVEAFGFPFAGPAWRPHVTVASVRPEAWEAVWPRLAADPPSATVRFPYMGAYAIKGFEPVLVRRFALAGVRPGPARSDDLPQRKKKPHREPPPAG